MGSLQLVLGPMCSGKTTELLTIAHRNALVGKCLFINSKIDTREFKDGIGIMEDISTHNKTLDIKGYKHPNINFVKLVDLKDVLAIDLENYPVVLIDESQFMENLISTVNLLVNKYDKQVYLAGLNSSYKRTKFGSSIDLVPDADEVTILKTAFCRPCADRGIKKVAMSTHCLIDLDGDVHISHSDFIPVCRACYNELNKDRPFFNIE